MTSNLTIMLTIWMKNYRIFSKQWVSIIILTSKQICTPVSKFITITKVFEYYIVINLINRTFSCIGETFSIKLRFLLSFHSKCKILNVIFLLSSLSKEYLPKKNHESAKNWKWILWLLIFRFIKWKNKIEAWKRKAKGNDTTS